jgi:hypothetical protein
MRALAMVMVLLAVGCGDPPPPPPAPPAPPPPAPAELAWEKVEENWARLARLHPGDDPAAHGSSREHAEELKAKVADVRFGGGLARYLEALTGLVRELPREGELPGAVRERLRTHVARTRHLMEDLAWVTSERKHAVDVVLGGSEVEHLAELDANEKRIIEVAQRCLSTLLEGAHPDAGLALAATLASRARVQEEVRVFTLAQGSWSREHPFEVDLADALYWFGTQSSTSPKLRVVDRRRALGILVQRTLGDGAPSPDVFAQFRLSQILRAMARLARHWPESLTEEDDRDFTRQVAWVRDLVESGKGGALVEALGWDTHPFEPLGEKHAKLKQRAAWVEGLAVLWELSPKR